MNLSKITQEASKLTSRQLEVQIQLTCEKMHQAYLRNDEITRKELGRIRDIYNDFYQIKLIEENREVK